MVNLTGKPEPVFTADQFAEVGVGGGGFHYQPHFEGSGLTPEDIMDDLQFVLRKHRLTGGGKYGRYAE